MGLERLACIMQDVGNLFEVDTVRSIMLKLSEMAKVTYHGSSSDQDVSLRVITDHIRTATFLISDGVLPSNEGRGYILRRVLRRAARHGRLLGIKGSFLSDLCETVIHENCSAYPELTERHDFIKKTIAIEEERFSQTLDSGLAILEKMLADLETKGEKLLPGADVFKLYDTFGFPIDLTRELTEEKGIEIDEDGFAALMKEQKKKARDARATLGDFGWSDVGTWGSVYQHSRKDRYANAVPEQGCYLYDTRSSIVSLPKDKVAVISGLKEYIVVDTDDVLMICPRSEEQNIKKFIDEVKFHNGDKHI